MLKAIRRSSVGYLGPVGEAAIFSRHLPLITRHSLSAKPILKSWQRITLMSKISLDNGVQMSYTFFV